MPRGKELHLVNATSWDIEMHYRSSTTHVAYGTSARWSNADWLAEGLRRRSTIFTTAVQPILTTSPSLVSPGLDPLEKELFQYFMHRASLSLTTFGHDAAKIPQILIRMALSDNTPSATAIFMSMLALASFHHDGLQSRVAHFRISTLRALSASTKGEVGAAESIRHVAAGMLLCTLEIQQSSAESSHWLWYVCGSKKIIKTAHLDETAHDDDFTTLIGWVQYCDVLARFSLRHWQPSLIVPEGSANITFEAFQPAVCSEAQVYSLSRSRLEETADLCDAVVPPSDPRYYEVDYREYLKVLEWRLRTIPIKGPKDAAATDSHELVELYQLATLVYLRRASMGITPERPQTVKWVHRGLGLLKDFKTCAHPFPLLIFGCEAYTDEERASILELISRTEISTPFRNLGFVKAILQTIWVQNDLAEGQLEYIQNLGVVLSSTSNYRQSGWEGASLNSVDSPALEPGMRSFLAKLTGANHARVTIRPDRDFVFLSGSGPEARGGYVQGIAELSVPGDQHVDGIQLEMTGTIAIRAHEFDTTDSGSWHKSTIFSHQWNPLTLDTALDPSGGAQDSYFRHYKWPFELHLPGSIAETVRGCNQCDISYRLEACVIVNGSPIDQRDFVPVHVIRKLTISEFEMMDAWTVEGTWAKSVEYQFSIGHQAIALGTYIPVELIVNKTNPGVKLAKIEFVLREVHKIKEQVSPNIPEFEGERESMRWEMPPLAEACPAHNLKYELSLPSLLKKCSPDCDTHGIVMKHLLRLDVSLLHPHGLITEASHSTEIKSSHN
ncbi:hypothetical protein FDECE_8433 [Fusarium decemcellulare]|nr:hypothetical protein FDECE_8433 [Fusarium decemcellulare]